jgi:hypothetical protein
MILLFVLYRTCRKFLFIPQLAQYRILRTAFVGAPTSSVATSSATPCTANSIIHATNTTRVALEHIMRHILKIECNGRFVRLEFTEARVEELHHPPPDDRFPQGRAFV